MKKIVAHIILIICCTALSQAQESTGAIALDLPARNSLMFNKYILSPALSYAREDYRHITVNNKREFSQIGDAPETYLASFSGRFSEKVGAGLGLFQRNFGVFTAFGGILNFAYNAQLASESNLTFGLNLLAYNSRINLGRVITTVTDPLLNSIPSNFITAISPGINYGGGFLDVGLTINNLISYDVSNSQILKEQTQRGIQGHLMYSGYINSYGFFDNSKFSALGRAEFQEETSIYSGTVMLRIPKGFWIQGGYNTLYGGSAGVGFNITSTIALEYNYEKSLGNFLDLGSSHELTLAFILPTQDATTFRQERITGLLNFEKKRKSAYSKRRRLAQNNTKESAKLAESDILTNDIEPNVAEITSEQIIREQEQAIVVEKARLEADNQARLDAEALIKKEAEEQVKLALAEKGRLEAEKLAKLEAQTTAKEAAEEKALLATIEEARLEAEELARIDAEAIAKKAIEVQARLVVAEQARLEAEEQSKIDAGATDKKAIEEQARFVAAGLELLEVEEQARLDAEATTREIAEEQARLEVEEQTRRDTEANAKKAIEEQSRLVAAEIENQDDEENFNIPTPNDELGRSLQTLTTQTEALQSTQKNLLESLTTAVNIKDEDLKDLKNENDLSEQGIFVAPRPFKSVSQENSKIESLKLELENSLEQQNSKIDELEAIYAKRAKELKGNDEINQYYRQAIISLKEKRDETRNAKVTAISLLESIKIATQFERSRRIKRAAFDDEEDRYKKDQAALNILKQNTPLSSVPPKVEDFDFGEERSNNIQILKNVENTENAYYMVLAAHGNISKRDDFVKKVIASGYSGVNFFYDINTSKYYIYLDKTISLQAANLKLDNKSDAPYTSKISIIKIEN